MYYNYYKHAPYENDELLTSEIYTTSPTLSYLQEIILIYLKELAYYLLKLKEFGAHNEVIKQNILEAISVMIANIDYNKTQFQKLITILSSDLNQVKNMYSTLCQKNNVEPKFLKTYLKFTAKFDMSTVIKNGEKYFIKKNATYTLDQKNMFDVMLFLIKNICVRIIQIKEYGKDYEDSYSAVLTLLNAMNFESAKEDNAKQIIAICTSTYNNLVKDLSTAQEEAHGPREPVYIAFAPRNGKAILVSGIDMKQLESVLEATKDRGVDVYTHGVTMLMAHTLAKFRKYSHLVGHFGKGSESSLFDFAAFPGAILTTRYLFQRLDYLCRGRLFTTDAYAPKGIVKILDNNFEPLILAALASKGFTKKQQEVIKMVGYRQKELEENVQEIMKKMEKNQIKHLYIIGLLNWENGYKGYFDKFFKLMPKDCYALSLAYNKSEENILHIDSFYDYLFIYEFLEKINEIKPLTELDISIFITKCDQYTITNIINFKNLGIKNIYLGKCIPSLINPALSATLIKIFGINEFSTPEKDLAETLKI